MRIASIILVLLLLVTLTGCTSTQKGIVMGGAVGGIAGAAYGYATEEEKTAGTTKYAIIGAATGAIAGAIIGYFSGE